MRENVVDEHTPVEQIDPASLRGEIFAVELEVARVADDCGHAFAFEARLQNFKLAPRGHLAPVNNSDDRRRRLAAPLAIARKKGFEQHFHRFVLLDAITFLESRHHGQGKKSFCQRFRVTGAGGGFGVVFGELQGIRQEECVETRSGARPVVTGRNSREALFVWCERSLRKQRGIGERLLYDAFADCSDRFGDGTNAAVVFCCEEKRAEKWAMNAVAEFELLGAHPSVEVSAEFKGEFNIRPEKSVPCLCGRRLLGCDGWLARR